MFAAEDGVDTTWCRGAINSEREVARVWRVLESGMEENIRDLQPSLEMPVCRGIGDSAGGRAGRQLQRNDPRAWCWSTGWINGWSRTGCKCRAGRRDEANKKTRDQGQQSQHSAGSRTRSTRKRTPAATRITRHEGAHCAGKETISCKVMLGGGGETTDPATTGS